MLNDFSEQIVDNYLAVQLHNIAKQFQIANLLAVVKLTDKQLETYMWLVKETTEAN